MCYAGDSFAYDFEAALSAARERASYRQRTLVQRERDAEALYWRSSFPAPRAEQLHRHAEKFRSEGVAEVARAYGIELVVRDADAKRPRRSRRTTAALEAQVVDLRARGLIPTAIADTLNLADRRVQEILRRREAQLAA